MSTCQLQRTVSTRLPTHEGEFRLVHYGNSPDQKEHLALVMGDLQTHDNVLVRVHSECFTGDVLGSQRCDCGEQLHRAMELIAAEGAGVVIYLRQEGRGIGLQHKLEAYNLQDQGYDTVDANLLLGHQADERTYEVAVAILSDLGVRSLRLLTNNPHKLEQLRKAGLAITTRVPIVPTIHAENRDYLATKVKRMRHLLAIPPTITTGTNGHNSSSHGSNGAVPSHLLGLNGATTPKLPVENSGSAAIGEPPVNSSVETLLYELRAEAEAYFARHHLPFVTVSYAQSMDGSIAAADGTPLRISGEEAMKMTHMLRAAHDAILVGVGTVIADDPQLTVRLAPGTDPQPIVLDTHLRTPIAARCLQNRRRPWLVTAPNTAHNKRAPFIEAAIPLIDVITTAQGQLAIRPLLQTLANRGIKSIMVEGGATVIRTCLQEQIAQAAVITVAPIFIGGLPAVASRQDSSPHEHKQGSAFPHFLRSEVFQLGSDIICHGRLSS